MSEPGKQDQKEEEIRHIESRQIEQEILSALRSVYKSRGSSESSNNVLRDVLTSRYNDWQFLYGDQGLNSGGAGEAFIRLLGSGIMEEMPQMGKTSTIATKYGVDFEKKPSNDSDVGIVEVNTHIGQDFSDQIDCKFRFSTSLDNIKKRLDATDREINEVKRK